MAQDSNTGWPFGEHVALVANRAVNAFWHLPLLRHALGVMVLVMLIQFFQGQLAAMAFTHTLFPPLGADLFRLVP